MVPQLDNLDVTLTAEQNLRGFAHLFRIRHRERRAAIERALAIANLVDRRDTRVDQLSGGMRRGKFQRTYDAILAAPVDPEEIATAEAIWIALRAGVYGCAPMLVAMAFGLDPSWGMLHRIIGRCDGRNEASARLMERLGMRREAHLRENERVKGEWCDELVYAMLAVEWAAARAR